jgi:regulator of nucleoside diphosphate kinase
MLTEVDQVRLRELLESLPSCAGVEREHADLLSRRVSEARIIPQRGVPRDLVTMNSLVGLKDLDANEKWSCTLAYPQEADLAARRVSVAVPFGALILGQRVGDAVECPTASGVRRLRIERVYYQPEAAGDFHL